MSTSGAGLTGVADSSVAWGDYDNDGDLDILLTGADGGGGPVAKLYRNEEVDCLDLTSHSPVTHAVGVAVTANITAGFDAAVNAATVTTRTFTVRSSFRGLFTDTATVSGSGLTRNPSRDFFAGEQVQVVGTAACAQHGRRAPAAHPVGLHRRAGQAALSGRLCRQRASR